MLKGDVALSFYCLLTCLRLLAVLVSRENSTAFEHASEKSPRHFPHLALPVLYNQKSLIHLMPITYTDVTDVTDSTWSRYRSGDWQRTLGRRELSLSFYNQTRCGIMLSVYLVSSVQICIHESGGVPTAWYASHHLPAVRDIHNRRSITMWYPCPCSCPSVHSCVSKFQNASSLRCLRHS